MFKLSKLLTTLVLSIILGTFSALPSFAQSETDIYAEQPPLTEHEVRVVMNSLAEINQHFNDQAKVSEIIVKSGLEPIRFAYISAKISIARMQLQGVGYEIPLNLPKSTAPNAEEIAIIEKFKADFPKITPNHAP